MLEAALQGGAAHPQFAAQVEHGERRLGRFDQRACRADDAMRIDQRGRCGRVRHGGHGLHHVRNHELANVGRRKLAPLLASQDGVGPAASFIEPAGLAVDAAGTVYVTAAANLIRKITPVPAR